jgi:hypothetical protein
VPQTYSYRTALIVDRWLVLLAPFTLAHAVYRPVALLFVAFTGARP